MRTQIRFTCQNTPRCGKSLSGCLSTASGTLRAERPPVKIILNPVFSGYRCISGSPVSWRNSGKRLRRISPPPRPDSPQNAVPRTNFPYFQRLLQPQVASGRISEAKRQSHPCTAEPVTAGNFTANRSAQKLPDRDSYELCSVQKPGRSWQSMHHFPAPTAKLPVQTRR
jgi:hypothetical protein